MLLNKSLFYANDKVLKDALVQKKVKNEDLRELFFSRGIINSRESERDFLANYFCRLNHDYYDHQLIAAILSTARVKDRYAFSKIEGDIKSEVVEGILNQLKAEYELVGDAVSFNKIGDRYEFKIKYQSTNYGKSEFKQVSENEDTILIENSKDNGFVIRFPSTPYSESIKEKIIDSAFSENKDLEVKKVSIADNVSSVEKSNFFKNLAKNMPGWSLVEIIDVYVFNPKEERDVEEEGDDATGVHIKKANLKGTGILNSTEYKGLLDKGFYISKIVWTSEDKTKTRLIECEAQFLEPKKCERFSYSVRGQYLSAGNFGYNKTRKKIEANEESKFHRLIEDSAFNALDALIKK